MTAPLLIEIGLEELPPATVVALADQLADAVCAGLDSAGLQRRGYQRFATPRRLAVRVDAVQAQAPGYEAVNQGPGVDIAFDDDGQPTAAATGFARAQGTTVDALAVEQTAKGRRLVHRHSAAGRSLAEIIEGLLNDAVARLDIPKRMRWGGNTATFVRPVHWLTVLHGTERLPASLFGIQSGRQTVGHRFHHREPIELATASDYDSALQTIGYVVADPDKRAKLIDEQVDRLATEHCARVISSAALLAEINALVEFPVALVGAFDPRYFELPREVLIAVMEHHQRYLPLEDADGQLTNQFILVANLDSRQPQQVIEGNERVIRPRLDDALFFWRHDLERGLASLMPRLSRVLFEKTLGSVADKQTRIARIAARIGPLFGVTRNQSARAAQLAKADLLTEMVDEFPDLQGVMGGYYASNDGESAAVADAIRTQYQPAGAHGPIPDTALGRVLALADRLDTLAGIFAVDKRPTGDKDPYALRRAALGVVRILVESGVRLDLGASIRYALSVQPIEAPEGTAEALRMFHVERLRSYFLDNGATAADLDAVLAVSSRDPVDIAVRLDAVAHFKKLSAASSVYESHKRIRNILKKQGGTYGAPIPSRYREKAETDLSRLLDNDTAEAAGAINYAESLESLTEFAEPLSTFFDQVRIIVDDDGLRTNRLALLAAVDRRFCQVADISHLAAD